MGNKLYIRHTMSDQHSTLGSIGHKKSMRMLSSDLKYPCHPYDLDMIYIYRYSFCLSPRTMPSVRFELTKLYATDLKSASFDRSEKMAQFFLISEMVVLFHIQHMYYILISYTTHHSSFGTRTRYPNHLGTIQAMRKCRLRESNPRPQD